MGSERLIGDAYMNVSDTPGWALYVLEEIEARLERDRVEAL